MIRKYLLPLLALAGIGYGIYVAVQDLNVIAPAQPVSQSPQSPYTVFVAGAGIVEASTENILIGTHVAGIVTRIYVQIGSQVKAGQPLFTIDDRVQLAQRELLRASVQVAEAQLADARDQHEINAHLDKRVVSEEALVKTRDTLRTADAQLAQVKAQLSAVETDLDRLTVKAPVDGQVLQMKVHLGEFAQTGELATPLLVLGNVDMINTRVDVDENEAWRVRAGAPCTGFLRGNRNIHTPMRFVRFEPYVIPKKSLTGDSTERVDTRVLQVIYTFKRGELPIFVGQQMDVFIDAPENPVASVNPGRL